MKTFFRFIAVSGLIVIGLSGCNKDDDTVFNSHFYTSQNADEISLSLYIDGNYEGELPNLTDKPDCNNTESTLSRTLESGKYNLTTKDESGNLVNELVLEIKRNSASITGKEGGDRMLIKDDCLIVEFF